MSARAELDRVRHHARRPLARTPFLWDAAMALRASKRSTLARRDTALVIDGFLRSGNTFSVAAFVVANGDELHLGRHLHGGAHILRAARLGVPALVLIRRPADAVASYLVRRPSLTPRDALLEYMDFYRTCWPARDHFVVGLFDDVITDFGSVVRQVNQRFGTSFRPYEPTDANRASAFALVDEMNRRECRGEIVESHVGRPSDEREQRKREILARLRGPECATSLARAQAWYDRYAALATASRGGKDSASAGSLMRRVLLVGKGEPDRGGIPSFLQMLLESELASHYRLDFLNVAHHGVPEGGEITKGNVIRTLRDAKAVFLRASGHDIVHIHSALAPTVTVTRAGLLALAARSRGCAVVVHAHGGNIETWLEAPMRRRMLQFAMLPAHRVVAVWSAGERALAGAIGERKVRLVQNGIDCSRYLEPGPPNDPPRVLYVGLLTPRKGVLDLIEASRMLKAQGVRHELHLLGGIPDEGPTAAAPVHEAAAGTATMLGTRSPEDMPQAYAEADVFCLPSWWEAMPMSVLEAMAAGLPVVATDVGDVSRLVSPTCGRVVPTRSPRLVADALRPLLEDAESRRAMGGAARDRVRTTFSSSSTAMAIARLYGELRPQDGRNG